MGPATLETRVRDYLASLGALGLATATAPTITALADGDWAEAWREHFRPLPVGRRLLVAPPWDVPGTTQSTSGGATAGSTERRGYAPSGSPARHPPTGSREPDSFAGSERVVLVIEPGRAFGTGHHGSTAGCLTLLERVLERERPSTAIDLGTGSGILAIAAARLGVPAVLAVDDDPDAVAVAAANARVNDVSARVECRREDAATLDASPAPLLLANLLTAAHARLAARYRRLLTPGGALLLGGILDAEAGAVRERLRGEGLTATDGVSIEGWTALGFRAPLHDRA